MTLAEQTEFVKNYHWVRELRGREEAIKALQSLERAKDDLYKVAFIVEKVDPEYYEKLIELRKKMSSLCIDLHHQIDGYISFS
jgi:hypothetical protein